MRPLQRFEKLFKAIRMCGRACGSDIFDPQYKVNAVTKLVMFCITIYFIFSAYTVAMKFHENWGVALEAFCMVGSVLQGISKLFSGILYRPILLIYIDTLTSIYGTYETKDIECVQLLNKCLNRLQLLIKIFAYIYIAVVAVIIGLPLTFWFFTGRKWYVMQFNVPFVHPDTDLGYFVTIGVQTMCLTFGAFGNFTGDMVTLVHFVQIPMFVDIFEFKVERFNEAINGKKACVLESLMDILKWHQLIVRFFDYSDILFYWINFTEITTLGFSIVLTLFIIFTGEWPGSYGYLIMSFTLLYMYGGLGTMTEIAKDGVITLAYNISWYELTAVQQKMVHLMLLSSQTLKEATVGGIAPLSVNTSLQVTKMVYSVFMLLLNYFR